MRLLQTPSEYDTLHQLIIWMVRQEWNYYGRIVSVMAVALWPAYEGNKKRNIKRKVPKRNRIYTTSRWSFRINRFLFCLQEKINETKHNKLISTAPKILWIVLLTISIWNDKKIEERTQNYSKSVCTTSLWSCVSATIETHKLHTKRDWVGWLNKPELKRMGMGMGKGPEVMW